MVPVASRRVSRAPRYSGTRVRVRSAFTYMAITFYGRLFQVVRLAAGLVTLRFYTDARPTTPSAPLKSQISNLKSQRNAGFGLFRFRSPLLAESLLLSFPSGTEMVHFPELARTRLWIQRAVPRFYRGGFPHSEIPGSKSASLSPRLIAGNHVLHRRLAPRHPPYALSSLTIKSAQHTLKSQEFTAYSPQSEALELALTIDFRLSTFDPLFRRFAYFSSTCRRRTISFQRAWSAAGDSCALSLPCQLRRIQTGRTRVMKLGLMPPTPRGRQAQLPSLETATNLFRRPHTNARRRCFVAKMLGSGIDSGGKSCCGSPTCLNPYSKTFC